MLIKIFKINLIILFQIFGIDLYAQQILTKEGNVFLKFYINQDTSSIDHLTLAYNDYYFERMEIKLPVKGKDTIAYQIKDILPQDIWLFYKISDQIFHKKILVNPPDSIFIFLDPQKDSIGFLGSNSNINFLLEKYLDFMLNKLPNSSEYNNALKLEPDEFKNFHLELFIQNNEYLKTYCENQFCPTEFKNWAAVWNQLHFLNNLMTYTWRSFNYGIGNSPEQRMLLPDNYLDFVDSISITIDNFYPSEYFFYLTSLMNKKLKVKDLHEHRFIAEKEYLLSHRENLKSEIKEPNALSEEEAKFLDNLPYGGINFFKWSNQTRSKFLTIRSRYSEELFPLMTKKSFQKEVHNFLNVKDSAEREILLYRHLKKQLESKSDDIIKDIIPTSEKYLSNARYKKDLNARYDYYKNLKIDKDLNAVLLKSNHNDADVFLKYISNKFPGKPILLIFWGTWCKPCKEDFQFLENKHEQLEEFEQIFLCIACPLEAWKSDIIQYKVDGTHYNINELLQDNLKKLLNIYTYPSYFSFSEKGIRKLELRPQDQLFIESLYEEK